MSRRISFLVVAWMAGHAASALAQCPDGTPPPCGATRPVPRIPLSARASIVVIDIRSAAGDSLVGRLGTDALRLSLEQSEFVRVMAPQTVADGLRRMQRNPSEALTLAVARDLAIREGAGLLLDGEVTRNGSAYVFVLRVITVDSAATIAVVPVNAGSVSMIPGAMDRAARTLRSRLGESVQKVRASPPLERVTTSSIQALEKYTAGARANDVERNYPKAVALLKEAIAIDTTFAEAWRKLAAASANGNLAQALEIDRYRTKAFQNRHRLSPRERIRAEITYYGGRDEQRQYAAFEDWFKLTGDSADLASLAGILFNQREYARAERMAASALRAGRRGENLQVYVNALLSQGKLEKADSVVRIESGRGPQEMLSARYECTRSLPKGCAQWQRHLDSLRTHGRPVEQSRALGALSRFALMGGQIELWRKLQSDLEELDKARGIISRSPGPAAVYIRDGIDMWIRGERASLAPRLDSVDTSGFGATALVEMAKHYAWGNRPDRARDLLTRARASSRGSEPTQAVLAKEAFVEAEIAASEGRWDQAIAKYKAADIMPYRESCTYCLQIDIARVHAARGNPDSAVAYYDRALSSPITMGELQWDLPPIYEKSCILNAAAGRLDRARAACRKFLEFWEGADPELQPRVAEARRIIEKINP